MDTLYTPAEIAEKLKLKKSTIYELIKRGELPSSKVGKQLRISSFDLSAYLSRTSGTPRQVDYGTLPMESIPVGQGLVISGQVQVLDYLCAMMEHNPQGQPLLRSYMNSYNSLYALYFEKVHAVTCSLWSDTLQTFDFSLLEHFLPGKKVTAIHLCKYQLGFYVEQGNPNQIHADMAFGGHNRVVNREKGSEARGLLDSLLRKQHILSTHVTGYDRELLSHSAVAAQIASHSADFGIGDEHTAHLYREIEFIPLETKSIDLIFLDDSVRIMELKSLARLACSAEFIESLALVFGYDTAAAGEIIANVKQ